MLSRIVDLALRQRLVVLLAALGLAAWARPPMWRFQLTRFRTFLPRGAGLHARARLNARKSWKAA